jgi:hypothetical protein
LWIMPDVTGSGKTKMVADKPEVLIILMVGQIKRTNYWGQRCNVQSKQQRTKGWSMWYTMLFYSGHSRRDII